MLSIHDLVDLSGLTKGQIEQAISRHRISLLTQGGAGKPRNFFPADAFTICIAGELQRLGLDWRSSRDLLAQMKLPRLNGRSEPNTLPTPMKGAAPHWLLLSKSQASLFDSEGINVHLQATETTSVILINATEIAKRIP